LCGFNICSRTNRAHPGSNSLDYDLDARQCAFDFTLHPLNLGLEESLQLPKFGREYFKSVDRLLISTKLPVSASPSDESDFSAGAAEDDGGESIGVSSKLNLTSTRA
jgi:hypothetical protein